MNGRMSGTDWDTLNTQYLVVKFSIAVQEFKISHLKHNNL